MAADRQNEYIDKAMVAYEQAVTCYTNLDLWTKVDSSSNIQAYTQANEDGLDTLKVELFVDKAPAEVATFLYDHFPFVFKEACAGLCGVYREEHKFSDKARLCYVQLVPPAAMVSKRFFHQFDVFVETSENTYANIMTSVDFPDGPAPEGEIKGDNKFQVIICEPVGDDTSRTHLVLVLNLHPGGGIPTAVANAINRSRVTSWETIKQILDGKLYKE